MENKTSSSLILDIKREQNAKDIGNYLLKKFARMSREEKIDFFLEEAESRYIREYVNMTTEN